MFCLVEGGVFSSSWWLVLLTYSLSWANQQDMETFNTSLAMVWWVSVIVYLYSCHYVRWNNWWKQVKRWKLVIVSEMWYQIFLWALFSSMFVHVIASLIAVCRLRKHKLGRWIPVVIVAMGVLSPLTGGVVTSRSYTPFMQSS